MISFRSVNFYLLIIFILVTLFSLLGFIPLSSLDIAAYACSFWGISFFYTSYLKQYKVGIALSSILFLIGAILLVFSSFEILNFGNIFVPSSLVVIGISLLISNLLTKSNRVSVLFSVLSLFAGVWLVISRGTATVELYLSSVYALSKNYLWIGLFLGVIIFLYLLNFKKKDTDQE